MPPPSTLPTPGQAVTVATTRPTAAMLKSYFPPPSPPSPRPFRRLTSWRRVHPPLPPLRMGGADRDIPNLFSSAELLLPGRLQLERVNSADPKVGKKGKSP